MNKKAQFALFLVQNGASLEEALEATSASAKDPYTYRKDEVSVPISGESVIVREQKKRMARSTYAYNLVKKQPGITQKDLTNTVFRSYPDTSRQGWSSFLCNASNGTGAYTGMPLFHRVWDNAVQQYTFTIVN